MLCVCMCVCVCVSDCVMCVVWVCARAGPYLIAAKRHLLFLDKTIPVHVACKSAIVLKHLRVR